MTLNNCESLLPGIKLHLPPVPPEILDITYEERAQEKELSVYPESLLLPFSNSQLVNLPIKHTQYLCKGEDIKTTIEISLDNKDNLIQFKAGDTIGVLPQNDAGEIDYLIERLGLKIGLTQLFTLSLKNVNGTKKVVIPPHLPTTGKLKDVLMSCVDVRSILKKIFICALSNYTDDSVEKRCLEELSSKEGSSLYNEQILNNRMNIIDLLKKYSSCTPPVTLILQYLPRLMPRPYSVSNTFDANENVIKFCFSVVEITPETKGIATGWFERIIDDFKVHTNTNKTYSDMNIENLSEMVGNMLLTSKNDARKTSASTLPVYLRKSNFFCLPNDKKKPLIMIALGTGVAPFIGFISERQKEINTCDDNSFGESILYFGCRYSDRDFIYKKDLEQFMSDGVLTKLRVSHSRDFNSQAKYVQDNIVQDAEYLVNLIEEKDAVIFVCGDINKISGDITKSLVQCYCTAKNIETNEAEEIVNCLKKNNRYIQDIWS